MEEASSASVAHCHWPDRPAVRPDWSALGLFARHVGLKKLSYVVETLAREGDQGNAHVLDGLDAGCGSGEITLSLALRGYRMVGLDLSTQLLRRTQALADDISREVRFPPVFAAADIHALPFAVRAERFDFCICSDVLEHLQSPRRALAQLHTVIRPGGLLLVTIPNGYGPYSVVSDHLRSALSGVDALPFSPSPHIHFFTLGRISAMLRDAGFRVLNVGHSDFLSFFNGIPQHSCVCRLDCHLADRLPSAAVSGWYIPCRREDQ